MTEKRKGYLIPHLVGIECPKRKCEDFPPDCVKCEFCVTCDWGESTICNHPGAKEISESYYKPKEGV